MFIIDKSRQMRRTVVVYFVFKLNRSEMKNLLNFKGMKIMKLFPMKLDIPFNDIQLD